MFAHFVAAAILALPLFASAQSCDTGSLRCCDNVQDVDSDSGAGIAGLLGIVLQPGTQLGFGCNPIGVIGNIANGGACEAHPVCCDQDAVGGLINVGCVPVNVL